ncbi:MAG: alcohol dehydrogenase catalytic domain-containing protein [Elusimicrobia bacterium]|nr:alcohol dehydrogenase catalytic domain-containing protein [Elusimicrobiota bacterium]
MRALVYKGRHRLALETRPVPRLAGPTDAVVRMTTTTLCGTDLHILKGDLPEVAAGRVLGHEGVGVVEEAGTAVRLFKPGDRVVVSCITACGVCPRCRTGMCSHCASGGWALGHAIDGTQAEFVRVPCADGSLHLLPDGLDEEAGAMFSDVMPTAYECGVRRSALRPGERMAVVGAGPIGLAVVMTAALHGPAEVVAVDVDENRLAAARELGATKAVECSDDGRAAETVRCLAGGDGVDVAVEAVGLPATFELCAELLAPGGRLANVGVHGGPAALRLERLWPLNVTVTTQLVDATTTPMLLGLAARGRLEAGRLVTHRFPFSEAERAYEVFAHAARERALKVALKVGE